MKGALTHLQLIHELTHSGLLITDGDILESQTRTGREDRESMRGSLSAAASEPFEYNLLKVSRIQFPMAGASRGQIAAPNKMDPKPSTCPNHRASPSLGT
jgi:hypothetical protein